MSKKYKVSQKGVFLGHFHGNTPADAVIRAIEVYGPYYDIDPNDYFEVKRGFKTAQIYVGEE